ncbi:zinc ribbon domain-containing protein [Arthrobacter sp. Br18]|uniref:FmdB family zinc ribbon protein n=1 Tax=Arthrobacter sp. Br18 TaxID=1312954 RepID=UPI0009DFC5EF|nr:zinc ribbon domain-containing protein [Arthrobacter sp. Br18]
MPIYEYRCARCSTFEVHHPMGAAPDVESCPVCRTPSKRRISAPNISHAGSAAVKLIDATALSASEPQVVTSRLPSSGRKKSQPYTRNPLHRKLPRP